MSTNCTCKDKSQEKTVTCFKCRTSWQVKLKFHERIARCKEHHTTIAICFGNEPVFCQTCTDNGYSFRALDSTDFPQYEIIKK